MILVVGATGLLGAEVCRRLRIRNDAVRGFVRRGSPREAALAGLGVQIGYGDLKDPISVDRACEGATTVVTTATATSAHGVGDSLEAVDRDGQLTLVDAAAGQGVGRFIYVSLSPNLPSNNPFVRYKRAVERAVCESGMVWTIIQPAAYMEIHAGPPLGWDFARGRARIMGSGEAPMSYISVHDVAEFTAQAVDSPHARNRRLHIAGPEPLSARDAVRIAERVTGRSFSVQRLPTILLKTLSWILRPVAPIPSSLMALGAANDGGEVVDMAPLLRDFPMQLTRFEDYVRRVSCEAPIA